MPSSKQHHDSEQLGSDVSDVGEVRVVFLPSGRRGTAKPGENLLGVARRLGADVDSACGGRAICGRCQVRVMQGDFAKHGIVSAANHLSPPTEAERRYDQLRGLREGCRLACQAQVLGDVLIDVPPESQLHRQLVRKEADARDIAVDPLARALFVQVEPPRLDAPSADLDRLTEALAAEWDVHEVEADPLLLPRLQAALRAGDWQVTAVLHQPHLDAPARLIDVRPGADDALYGLAVDIGSTTIAAHLVDLHSGKVLASQGAMNPQIRFGEDLMSRVSYSMMHPQGAAEMTAAVRQAIAELADAAARQAGIPPESIIDISIVGNPVMHHLFLGIDPKELGQAPFALALSGALELAARDTLRMAEGKQATQAAPGENGGERAFINPSARLYALPCIAGHVGADAAAVVLAEAPHERDEISLIVDVGTNAEIILGNRQRLLACSSPTGPAFEGAEITHGQRAAPGAIERVRIDRETLQARYKVIGCNMWSDAEGFEKAVKDTGITGICGSGIIEAVAEMYLAGIIDASGRFDTTLAGSNPNVARHGERGYAYVLRHENPRIVVTQEDVRAIQLAKAALYAGARLLMDRLGIDAPDRIRLAGAFGAHIDPLYAMVLGMIPDCPLQHVSGAGNAAGTGARMALVSGEARREVEDIVRRIEKIETATEERFQEHFVAAMAFPHGSAPTPNLAGAIDLPARTPPRGEPPGGEPPCGEPPRGRQRRRRRRQS